MKYAIMLNSCDKYSDLWPHFMENLSKNFDLTGVKIYTNSESTNFEYPGCVIKNIHPSGNVSWSNRLKNCAELIEEDIIFSIPEECIMESKIDIKKFNQAIKMMESNSNVASICFVHVPGDKYDNSTNNPFVRRKYNYRNMITQQAAIWRKEKYVSYISNNENPWEYEVLGSARGVKGNDEFFCVSDTEKEVTDYNYGYLIYRGYWCEEEVIRLENEKGIVFNLGDREMLKKEEIEGRFHKHSLFYWKLRVKKYLILLSKKFGRVY